MSLFKKAEAKSKRLKMLVFGPSGSGKTTMSLSFPSPAICDAEKGTDFYGDKFDFLRLQTSDHREIALAIDELMNDPGEVKTFIIDPYSKVDESIVLGHLMRLRLKNNNPNYSLQPLDFKSIKEERKLFINKLLALDMNIIVTAPDRKEYSTEPGEFMKVIGVGPEVPKDVPFMFDVVVEAYKTEEGVRMFRVHKDRTNLLPETFELSYNKLVEYIGVDGLERRAEVFTQQKAVSDLAGRTHEIIMDGKKILTAGISAEQLSKIQTMVSDSDIAKIQQQLVDGYAVNSFLDLRSDEADLFIETLTNKLND